MKRSGRTRILAPHWAQGEEEKGKGEANEGAKYNKFLTSALSSKTSICFFFVVESPNLDEHAQPHKHAQQDIRKRGGG